MTQKYENANEGYYGRVKAAEKFLDYSDLSKKDISRISPILEVFFDKVLDRYFSSENIYEKES